MKFLFNYSKSNSGFSIIEVMVAVGIISVGMMGVLSLMSQNVQVQAVTKNNLIASMLAQEGIELVRNIRDTNWLTSTATNYYDNIFATSTIDNIGIYTKSDLDFNDASSTLAIDSKGLYSAHGATSTIFKRLITVSSTTDYMNIKSTVRWTRNGQNHDYVAETILYDWR